MITKYSIPTNQEIAKLLNDIADLLEIQEADTYRIGAYRKGARLVRKSEKELAKIVMGGNGDALKAMKGIGESLSRQIVEYIRTGRSQLLLRLQGEVNPEEVFEQVPGVGHELAERIVRELGIKTLEELEQAAHDGSLAKVEGFGRKRVEAIQISLVGMMSGFGRRRILDAYAKVPWEMKLPDVDLLLEIDQQYRNKAKKNELKKIAPRRFNPNNIAWLPVMHLDMSGWSFTTLFSNTLRAHELKRTDDWVIIYFENNGNDGQATVVTETSGPLSGKRVVRGREPECEQFYLSDKIEG